MSCPLLLAFVERAVARSCDASVVTLSFLLVPQVCLWLEMCPSSACKCTNVVLRANCVYVMCCFSDSAESTAWMQWKHAGNNGTDSLPVHGGAWNGRPGARIEASLQQQYQFWGKSCLFCSTVGLCDSKTEIPRCLEQKCHNVPCVQPYGFCVWSTCGITCSGRILKTDCSLAL